MSTADLLGGTEPTTVPPDPARRLYRAGGLGGVGAFLAWTGQPVVVALAAGDVSDAPAWEDIRSRPWSGAVEVVLFSAVGLGALVLVLAVWQLLRLREATASVWQQVGLTGGVVGAAAWFLVGAESLRMYTSIGAGLPTITADEELQRVAIDGTYLDVTGALVLFAVGWTVWTVLLVTTARRLRVVGTPTAVFAGLTLAGPVAGLALPFGSPWWLLVFVLSMLVVGIVFLVRARR